MRVIDWASTNRGRRSSPTTHSGGATRCESRTANADVAKRGSRASGDDDTATRSAADGAPRAQPSQPAQPPAPPAPHNATSKTQSARPARCALAVRGAGLLARAERARARRRCGQDRAHERGQEHSGHEMDGRGSPVATMPLRLPEVRGMRRLLSPWLLVSALLVTTSTTAALAAPATKPGTQTASKTAQAPATKTTKTTPSPAAAAGKRVVTAVARAKEVKERPVRLVSTAPTLKPALKTALTAALNEEALDGIDLGFIVTDLKTGATLVEAGADALINPASNAKMITSSAALHVLKPEYRFKTDYYVAGTLRDGTLHGNLVVKGYGDPTIVSERLIKVANELYLFGVERITGSVVVDDSWFDANEEARGWELEESPDRAYAAPVNAVSVNYNAIAVYIRPGSSAGMPAIVRIDPPTERVHLVGDVMTESVGRGLHLVSQKDSDPEGPGPLRGTLLTIEGSMGVREPPARIYRRVYDPTRHFGSTLTSFLQQRGVKMRHSVVKGPVPAGARLILVDKSRALKEIVDDLNHYSNNIIAETLIKAMGAEVMGAPGTFENGLKVSRDFLEQRVGFAPGSYTFENGSGLNDVNRFTARQLTQLVRFVAADYEIATEWFTSLAVAGTQGTIHHRMRDTPAQRRLRAKTGTLRGVSALSGTVVQPDGNVVAFSMLAQGYKSGAGAIWKVQNLIGSALASDGQWNVDKEEAEEAELVSVEGTARPIEVSVGGG